MNSFFQRLREGIMPFHDEAEKVGPLHSIVSGTISMDEYRNVLMRLHGFVDPAERIIESRIHEDGLGFDYETMKRLPHLEKDLAFLGTTKGEVRRLPTCEDLAALETVPQAIGILYPFEGSRLGGQVLSKALRERFGFSELQGYAYFASNGANVGVLWQSFKDEVGRYVDERGHDEEIIESARNGFASLNTWLLEK